MYETFDVFMRSLGRQRTVRVLLPEGYGTSLKVYPVLYIHDGQNCFRDEEANFGVCWDVEGALMKVGIDIIVVGVDCNHEGFKRSDEYDPWGNETIGQVLFGVPGVIGGEGKAYVDFLVNELKPLIDEKYRTNRDVTGLAGSSMGGHISTYAACAYPEMFSRVACLSSAFWFNQDKVEELVSASDLSQIKRWYMDTGTEEVTATVGPDVYLEASDRVYDKVKRKVRNCRYEVVEGGKHHEKAWKDRLPDVLAYLFFDQPKKSL
ncbi:alpha/beta hydrolase [Alteribacter aurantiacus]|uniref:alpha/beta hydrolase n=1 Tax=Alteribacter aurantiacus TaxID=254410 RepID=UPI0004197C5C|nr:alpha/beta hydrolase-fold protein [Alteribacter aurantiacus]